MGAPTDKLHISVCLARFRVEHRLWDQRCFVSPACPCHPAAKRQAGRLGFRLDNSGTGQRIRRMTPMTMPWTSTSVNQMGLYFGLAGWRRMRPFSR